MVSDLPERPPFALRARILTPLAAGGTREEPDGVLVVDGSGRIAWLGQWPEWQARGGRVGPAGMLPGAGIDPSRIVSGGRLGPIGIATPGDGSPEALPPIVDLRPWLVLPGLIDLHAHLPQLPHAGLGAGLDLLSWLERYIFPLEREFDEEAANRLAPDAFRAFAMVGTTTVLAYAAIFEPSTDAVFRAAEAHGIRAIVGKVMMDRLTYDTTERRPAEILELSLRQSADLCARWDGRDGGRLRYAFTPRFAVSCSADMLRESARLAASTGAYWQTHLAEDRAELAEVARLFPDARGYLDVYDRAGALGPRTILAHAIHLSGPEVARLAETDTRLAHCPASNLFLGSGLMRLAAYREAGIVVGLGSDVSGGPDLSIFTQMRVGSYTQTALRAVGAERRPLLEPADWLRVATLDAARVLGIDDVTGSLEPGKEADLIAIDPARTDPVPGAGVSAAADVLSRLIYRTHPAMVRAAWVRGRRLDGPG